MKKGSDLIMIIFCSIFILSFGVWIFAAPQREFSEEENRALEGFPKVSVDNIANGRFSKELGSFYGDQFPLRRGFTAIKAVSELALLRVENNGVVFGDDGYLVMRPEYKDLILYGENLSAVSDFCRKYEEQGTEVRVFFAPRGIDVLSCKLPSFFSDGNSELIWSAAESQLPTLVTAAEELRHAAAAGEYVWYKTDHHWTALGAYKGYKKIVESFEDTPREPSEFTVERVSDSFLGTVWSRAGITWGEADGVELIYPKHEKYRMINYDNNSEYDTLFFREKLETKDKYAVFLGGNYGHIGIYGEGDREKLLVIKDSFANALLPLLASHYDIEVYDLRYLEGRISEEIAATQPDKILILYGIDTAVTDASLKLLGR